MITGSIARRYAKALLGIGVERKSYEQLGAELESLATTVDHSTELRGVLQNPMFPSEQRRAVLEEIAKRLRLSKTVHDFAMLLLDRNRIGSLSAIAREHRALVDEQAGRVRAVLTSAAPLGPAVEARIKKAIETRTGKTVLLEKRTDAALLGGVVTQIGDMVYDGSVRSQLADIRQQLLQD